MAEQQVPAAGYAVIGGSGTLTELAIAYQADIP